MVYTGNEHFTANKEEIEITMTDFWQWSHPDFLSGERRSVLSKFIVASSLGMSVTCPQDRTDFRNKYDLLTEDGLRIKVEAASYLQSLDEEHPNFISYPIGGMPDAYVFCLYKATAPSQNPLNLDLWDFFVIDANTLKREKPESKSITLPGLQELGIWQCDYFGITDGIKIAMDV